MKWGVDKMTITYFDLSEHIESNQEMPVNDNIKSPYDDYLKALKEAHKINMDFLAWLDESMERDKKLIAKLNDETYSRTE